jgi:succinoglycan biosynthesis protein ExoM
MDGNEQIDVTVCICTFRRPSILSAVESVTSQVLPDWISLRILVIDNDDTPSAQNAIESFCAKSSATIHYHHAPGRNISVARNAALDVVSTRWLAFIDDDESASPLWLARLLSARVGAQAVFGPSEARYDHNAPLWIIAGDYHSNRVMHNENPIKTGYTSNALIDMNFVRKFRLRFDLALGRTGGEDTVFFYALHRSGGVLRYVKDAIVFEHVAASRTNIRWVTARRYRAGQAYAMMFRNYNKPEYWRIVLTSPFKIAACACASAAMAISPKRAMWWSMRGIFHVGTLSLAVGARVYEEYSLRSAS